jgi:hypothetical protein
MNSTAQLGDQANLLETSGAAADEEFDHTDHTPAVGALASCGRKYLLLELQVDPDPDEVLPFGVDFGVDEQANAVSLLEVGFAVEEKPNEVSLLEVDFAVEEKPNEVSLLEVDFTVEEKPNEVSLLEVDFRVEDDPDSPRVESLDLEFSVDDGDEAEVLDVDFQVLEST